MTYRIGRHVFFGARASLLLCVAALPLAGAGCASSAVDGTVPVAATAPAAGGAIDTGTFPNLNIAPKVAAEQFTEEQKAAKLAELHAAQQRQGRKGSAGDAGSTGLTKLAKSHGSDTLKQIEGKCDPIDPNCK